MIMNSKKNTRRSSGTGSTLRRAVRLVRNAVASEQTAIDLLKSQHEEVKALFKKIEKASARAQKTKLFDELASKLVGHDAIEREIFYPACERGMGMTDLLGEALVEHGVVEFSLYQADQARQAKDFPFKCQVLSEIVLHHVKEEEDDFFPKVEKALGRDKLIQLGARMKERFEETQAADFRAPLHSNLKQVLRGTLKPVKRRAAKRKAA
jgi:iron-sulfur cluster repair protein YtfE (RIC family)